MKNKQLLPLSLLSGLILHLAWTDWCPGYPVFLGFVPLLFIEQYVSKNNLPPIKMYWYAALAFLTWNIFNTWWLVNASLAGMLVAFVINTFLFSGVFQLFHLIKRATNPRTGYFSLVVFWVAFEYFYLHAEISWTWLNLGNAFAKNIMAIQWYEYTGTLGGTLWILIMNLMFFRLLNMIIEKRDKILIVKNTVLALLLIAFPLILSGYLFKNYEETENPVEIVAIQPNVDPYEKFIGLTHTQQTQLLIDIAREHVDENTDYVVCPETAVTSYTELDGLERSRHVTMIRDFVKEYPQLKFIVGFTLRNTFGPGETPSATAQKYENSDRYYDTYNSALQIDTTETVQVYHKSELVVGVEKMPYPKALGFLRDLMVRLGGTFRSHAIQEERSNLTDFEDQTVVAPVICYENIFGEFVSDFVKAGANLIVVPTNEGWWGNTQGYRHLNYYSQVRAIENRRAVVRSANTGISSIINQKGEIIKELGWWKQGGIKGRVHANNKKTFYTVHGDYLGKASLFFSMLIGLMWLVRFVLNRKRSNVG
jgi:apolipoprotein N-acyltransferase